MKRSAKPPAVGSPSTDVEDRALANLLTPPSALAQLTEWRAKATARLAKPAKTSNVLATKKKPLPKKR